jgi:heterodisulfide reductase subunit C
MKSSPTTGSPLQPAKAFAALRHQLQACMQCGACSASCPNAFAMDQPPRMLWQRIIRGRQPVLSSHTFALCSACYMCTLRCPRGLPLTEAMATLKQLAAAQHQPGARIEHAFHASFLQSVRQHGRVSETGFMTRFFLTAGSPLLPFRFMPLGMRLMRRRRIDWRMPAGAPNKLAAHFDKAAHLTATDTPKE